jgi:predicted AlkP superfamily phosphohydrolase/phosphomutase
MKSLSPRWFAVFSAILCLTACGGAPSRAHGKRVIVLGVDGMDPHYIETHWSALPNLARLRESGGLTRLGTTTPPQSPVAWATFATGTDPARHGIFDFVHRDAATLQPLSSLGGISQGGWQLPVGPFVLPLKASRVRGFREGRTFWEILAEHGVPVTLIHMPGNYPPIEKAGEQISGMGTPDLEGSFGTFTYYTDDPLQGTLTVSGGRIVPVTREGNRVVLPVEGPPNTLRRDQRPPVLELVAEIDPAEAVMTGNIDGQRFVLKQGEWSPWIRVRFPLIGPVAGASGMFRLFARQLHPGLRIYRSALNIDPADAALPVAWPEGFGRNMAARDGEFYTQGIAEDTSALRQGVLTLPEFLEQSRLVAAEHSRILSDCLTHFDDGLLFFYFSQIDQNSHMLWGHHERELLETYQAVDREIGRVMTAAPDATLIVMSDHGFAEFNRAFNLNTWLARNGFLTLEQSTGGEGFAGVYWAKTKAYAIGLNALYLNLSGREKNGVVHSGAEADGMLAAITRHLLEFRDPQTGAKPVAEVSAAARGSNRYAPDLVIGYAPGYRGSWETALGGAPGEIVQPNTDAWVADHCMSPDAVPGVLMGTRRPQVTDPQLKDLTVTVLHEFGIGPDAAMTGRPVY